MNVQLDEYTIPITIIRKNNKNIYFRFKEDGTLYVTCHRLVPKFEIIRLIEKDKASILRLYKKYLKTKEQSNKFYYLGQSFEVVYDESLKNVSLDAGVIYTPNEKKLNKWLKDECVRVFEGRIDYCLSLGFTNIPPFSLRIRKMTSRWGVNNVTKRIITLNSELIKKDIELIDYVIVHELCHFYEGNHSSRFWEQVAIRYPDYKNARKRLRG